MGWRGGRWAGRDGPREVRPSAHFALFSPQSVPLARDVSSLEGFKPPFRPRPGPLRSHVLLPLQAARAAPFLLVASPAGESHRPDRLLFLTHLSLLAPAPLTVAPAPGRPPCQLPDLPSVLGPSLRPAPPPSLAAGAAAQVPSMPSSPASMQPTSRSTGSPLLAPKGTTNTPLTVPYCPAPPF